MCVLADILKEMGQERSSDGYDFIIMREVINAYNIVIFHGLSESPLTSHKSPQIFKSFFME